MSSLAEYVHSTRKRKGLKQEDIKARGGPSKGWIGSLEAGTRTDIPKPETLRKLAKGLGVEEFEVFAAAGMIPPLQTPGPLVQAFDRIGGTGDLSGLRFTSEKQTPIPYYGRIGCGDFVEVCSESNGERLVPDEFLVGEDREAMSTTEAFGDSMVDAGILPGMTMLIRCQDWAEPGQVVLVDIPLQGTTCKRYQLGANGEMEFAAESPTTYRSIPLVDGVRITGIVIEAWMHKSFRR